MATLKDVAKLACVDVSTVSRALNNTSYSGYLWNLSRPFGSAP